MQLPCDDAEKQLDLMSLDEVGLQSFSKSILTAG